jgi:mannose-6-phosphate isomerase-like protein (cupin superfamily)
VYTQRRAKARHYYSPTEEERMADRVRETVQGEGYAVGSLDGMGEGPGFRKVRRELGVEAFGANAIVIPAGYDAGAHFHDQQEELYFVHRGEIEITFGDDDKYLLGPGGLARVDPNTVRRLRNVGSDDAVYFIVGGKDGYVGRDGRMPEGEEMKRAGAG